MNLKDVPQVTELFNNHHQKYKIHTKFSESEVDHYFMPRDQWQRDERGNNVQVFEVSSFVVVTNDKITDFFSFYKLPCIILQHPEKDYRPLRVAYEYY